MNIIVYSNDAVSLAAGDVAVFRNPVFWRGEVEKFDAIYPCDRQDIMAAYASVGVSVYEHLPKFDASFRGEELDIEGDAVNPIDHDDVGQKPAVVAKTKSVKK